MKYRSQLWGIFFLSLALLTITALSPLVSAEEIYSSVIRIHVIAASDSPADQEDKLSVRDALLAYAEENLPQGIQKAEAAAILQAHLPQMTQVANSALKRAGSPFAASLALSDEYYPTRRYESISLPAGVYLSLQVKIGEAKGQNWWCILFPPACLNSARGETALAEAGMEEDAVKTVTLNEGSYQIRFRILELWGEAKERLHSFFSQ